MYRLIFSVFILLLVGGCSSPELNRNADFSVATANLLYFNPESAETIAAALIATGADILVINEAILGRNVTHELYNQAGYSTWHVKATIGGFNILVASKLGGTFNVIPVTHLSPSGQVLENPQATLRVQVAGHWITVIGAHIPSYFHFPEEHRVEAFGEITEMILDGYVGLEKGSASAGDLPIVTGDFNTLPSEGYMSDLYRVGLIDSFLANPDHYDYTWGYSYSPLLARIDYVLLSRHMVPVFQDVFDIPGSDHQGVIAGIKVSGAGE